MQQDNYYYIDPTVLSYLLNLTDQALIDQAFTAYLDDLTKLIRTSVDAYLAESKMSEEEKLAIQNKLLETVYSDKTDEQTNMPPDQMLVEKLDNPELQNRIKKVINLVNKGLYVTNQSKLTPEKKNALNEYLREVEGVIKTNMQNTIKLLEITEEYEKLKSEEEKQQVQPLTQPTAAMQEYQQFLKDQQPTQPPVNLTQN